jgi:hypothetical protein
MSKPRTPAEARYLAANSALPPLPRRRLLWVHVLSALVGMLTGVVLYSATHPAPSP